MGRVVDCHRIGEPDTIDEDHPSWMASPAGSRTAVAQEAVLVEAASVLIIDTPKIRTDITAFNRREALMSGQLVPAHGAPIPFAIDVSTHLSPLASPAINAGGYSPMTVDFEPRTDG
jgi:hypothetical protein